MQVKTNSIKISGSSLSLALFAGASLTLQLGSQSARANSALGDGYVITHSPGTERQDIRRVQKEQAKALKQHQRFEFNYIFDKRTRQKLQKQEKQNLKAQQKLQKQWLKQHQWSQQH